MKKLTIGILATIALAIIIPTAAFAAIPEITGTIPASDSMSENLENAKIHFSVATAVAENAVPNGQAIKGELTIIQGYLVYKFKVADSDNLVHKVIIDAGNGFTLYTSDGRSLDDYKEKMSEYKDKWAHHDKWSKHGDMIGKINAYCDMSPEEQAEVIAKHNKSADKVEKMNEYCSLDEEGRQAKIAEYKEKYQEMKEAFSAISEEDKQLIKNHFNEMKQEFQELSEEERSAKKAEFKAMMEEFLEMSLDEKIDHLNEFANSIRK